MIVADWYEHNFCSRNRSRYLRDMGRDETVSATGQLIVDIGNFASDRWKLRNCGLSTDVDNAVSNSNLNHDFRLLAFRGTGFSVMRGIKE
jgi:hypothetical protein